MDRSLETTTATPRLSQGGLRSRLLGRAIAIAFWVALAGLASLSARLL